MRIVKYVAPAALILGLVIGLTVVRADDAPKYTIKQVMDMAHKGDDALAKKVVSGNASDEEKAKLVELYSSLGADKPPKGDPDSWKSKTDALLLAAKDVQGGKDGSTTELKKAMDCGACHKVHKGK